MNKQELGRAIKAAAYLEGDFVLRSGKRSKYYLDKYRFETIPAVLKEVGRYLAGYATESTTRIAGAELGGVALAAAASMSSGLPFVIIRNQKKGYGTGKLFEGVIEKGETVLLVEDIATTGGQVIEAAKVITDQGARVEKIVAVLDRQEGARENIEGAGYTFEALFTSADLGIGVPTT
ncbi:MAG: orotate phosphoribosyltransferase [Phycisphaerales bacterium]|nr:MAG: orotate phosphoribosyltransferase [Phycisphaerales bacterium]